MSSKSLLQSTELVVLALSCLIDHLPPARTYIRVESDIMTALQKSNNAYLVQNLSLVP